MVADEVRPYDRYYISARHLLRVRSWLRSLHTAVHRIARSALRLITQVASRGGLQARRTAVLSYAIRSPEMRSKSPGSNERCASRRLSTAVIDRAIVGRARSEKNLGGNRLSVKRCNCSPSEYI